MIVQPQPARFKVHGCSRNRHDHRLGHTQLRSRRIALWSEQVARAVDGNWDRKELPNIDDHTYARALGRVLAHELGHLLLRLNGHRDRGLMRSAFSHRSLTARGRRAFRLAEEDLQAIRETLLQAVAKNKSASFGSTRSSRDARRRATRPSSSSSWATAMGQRRQTATSITEASGPLWRAGPRRSPARAHSTCMAMDRSAWNVPPPKPSRRISCTTPSTRSRASAAISIREMLSSRPAPGIRDASWDALPAAKTISRYRRDAMSSSSKHRFLKRTWRRWA